MPGGGGKRLRFFLDNCVPDSVGQALSGAGHEVIYQRHVIPPDSPDEIVALTSAENDAILLTFDRDHRAIAARAGLSQSRLGRLSRIDFRCVEPEAPQRIKDGLALIETEWEHAQQNGGRLWMEIQGRAFKTHR